MRKEKYKGEKMLRVILASRDAKGLARFAAGLRQDPQTEAAWVDSAAAALDAVGQARTDLVVVGEDLVDASPVACVSQLIRRNPMINCAMISDMDHDAFHQATEGLGILMQLPPSPSAEDARALLAKLGSIAVQLGGFAGTGAKE